MISQILSAGDLLLKMRSSRDRDDERIARYVDLIANDAEEMARIWTEVLQELMAEESVSTNSCDAISAFLTPVRPQLGNAAPYSRIRVFYDRLHFVLGEYNIKKADLLLEKLADIISTRDFAKEKVGSGLGISRWTSNEIESTM